jgi:hypothetical protein
VRTFWRAIWVGAICGLTGVIIFFGVYPRVSPAPDLKIESTPKRLERGRYLAHSVAVCVSCHSQRDWSQMSAPVVVGTEWSGGEIISKNFGHQYEVIVPSLGAPRTAQWTDGEWLWAIASGLRHSRRMMNPEMPFQDLKFLTEEDAYSLVVYLKSLTTIKDNPGTIRLPWYETFRLRSLPQTPLLTRSEREMSDREKGEYLAKIAGCLNCHTPWSYGRRVDQRNFQGNRTFVMPKGNGKQANVRSTPLNSAPKVGLGKWTEAAFINRFRSYTVRPLKAGEVNSPMPWSQYKTMTNEDLSLIFRYLVKVKPN